jgi:2-isopropylmalate synthase
VTTDLFLYDTTLRDGTQRKGLSLSLEDKLKIARLLDAFGVTWIEGGWPGSNPKDAEFFRRIRAQPLQHARVTAFGSTRRAQVKPGDDSNLKALLDAQTPAVALVGKTWPLHVTHVLETTLDENLAMISDSVAWMKKNGREVIFDAEHFFDGYRADPEYATRVVRAAAEAGADWVTLCDTNGGSLPGWIREVVGKISVAPAGGAPTGREARHAPTARVRLKMDRLGLLAETGFSDRSPALRPLRRQTPHRRPDR